MFHHQANLNMCVVIKYWRPPGPQNFLKQPVLVYISFTKITFCNLPFVSDLPSNLSCFVSVSLHLHTYITLALSPISTSFFRRHGTTKTWSSIFQVQESSHS